MRPILKTLGMALITACVMNQPLSAKNNPVSSAEAENISLRLEESIISGDPEMLNHLIYFPEFITRTGSRSPMINNVDTLTKIATGFGLFNIGDDIMKTAKNGSFMLVHHFIKDEEVHLLFRVYGDGGLNYEEITLIKVKDSIRAADIYSYELGESYAKLFSYRIVDMKTPDAHSSMTSREKYGTIFDNAMRLKNYSVARSAFEKFDEEAQNDKHLSLQYMQACKQLNEKLFRKSVDRFITLFPDEPVTYLLMINSFADSKDYQGYGGTIDRLDTLLHIDPFLNYFRGNLVVKMGNIIGGIHFYELVFEYDPGIWQNTEKLVGLRVVNNELVGANEAIRIYSRTPGYKKDLVESLYASYPALK